ncbi:MAG: terpene cyclase/mutase family protein [Propionibacteriaceae bacterium]|nr:terpene cyclase/mutase family protein [Propionibacteriaceae bacterium]
MSGSLANYRFAASRFLRVMVSALATVFAISTFSVPDANAADMDAAHEAAAFITSQLVGGDHLESPFGNESITADAVLALLATQSSDFDAEIASMGRFLAQSPYVSSGPEAASKLAIVATAIGADPRTFGSFDLIAAIKAGIGADGAFGSYPMPYSSALAIIALIRSGEDVDPQLVSWLIEQAEPDGSFSFQKGGSADPDNTGMVIQALSALDNLSAQASQTLENAKRWAQDSQQADGSWIGFASVNSTALLGSSLLVTGVDQTKAITYLAQTQAASGGLPANPGAEPDLLATAQAILLLSEQSYLTLPKLPGKQPRAEPSQSPSTESEPPQPTPPNELVPLTEDQGVPTWVAPAVAAGVIVVAVAALVVVRRKK